MKIKSCVFYCKCVSLCACIFIECHDEPSVSNFYPEPGVLKGLQFTWLATLQYIHMKKGNPHYFRVPRVILITRNFVLATANDVVEGPVGYALGNIIFSEYERDEDECQITMEELTNGTECEPTILLAPIAEVMIHPEYKKSDNRNSVALIKLMITLKSKYMLPVCLPIRKYASEKLFYVDFASDAPREFMSEEKVVDTIKFLPKAQCDQNSRRFFGNDSKLTKRFVCSDKCGFHSGAPSVIHEVTGHWTVVAISPGKYPCPDPLLSRGAPSPPRHLLIFPYISWISEVITGTSLRTIARNDPFGFAGPRTIEGKRYNPQKAGWIGRWWMGGIRCYDRGSPADELFRFYHEIFVVNPKQETNMRYYLELQSNKQTAIVCVKVGMPYNLGKPRVWDLYTYCIKLRIPVIKFTYKYKIQVEAWGTNKSLLENDDDIIEYDANDSNETIETTTDANTNE